MAIVVWPCAPLVVSHPLAKASADDAGRVYFARVGDNAIVVCCKHSFNSKEFVRVVGVYCHLFIVFHRQREFLPPGSIPLVRKRSKGAFQGVAVQRPYIFAAAAVITHCMVALKFQVIPTIVGRSGRNVPFAEDVALLGLIGG